MNNVHIWNNLINICMVIDRGWCLKLNLKLINEFYFYCTVYKTSQIGDSRRTDRGDHSL